MQPPCQGRDETGGASLDGATWTARARRDETRRDETDGASLGRRDETGGEGQRASCGAETRRAARHLDAETGQRASCGATGRDETGGEGPASHLDGPRGELWGWTGCGATLDAETGQRAAWTGCGATWTGCGATWTPRRAVGPPGRRDGLWGHLDAETGHGETRRTARHLDGGGPAGHGEPHGEGEGGPPGRRAAVTVTKGAFDDTDGPAGGIYYQVIRITPYKPNMTLCYRKTPRRDGEPHGEGHGGPRGHLDGEGEATLCLLQVSD